MAAACILHEQRLKGELQVVRRKGALCASSSSNNNNSSGRSCVRCRGELGRIINRGACCPACRQRVCKSCREYGRPNPTQWLCTLCHKHMELTAATGDWMNEFVHGSNKGKNNGINATETIKRSLQRSWTFSDTSPSPWSYLRGSPEMRAYSSMPRHQDCDFLPSAVFPKSDENSSTTLRKKILEESNKENSPLIESDDNTSSNEIETKSISYTDQKTGGAGTGTDSATSDMEFPVTSEVSSVESSPVVDKRGIHDVVEPLTGTVFRRVTLRDRTRVDARNLPPGVTPPRSRRHLRGERQEELAEGLNSFLESAKALLPDSEDYKLVFISSDSSSREELHSDDGSSTSSSLVPSSSGMDDCEWDYFEYCYHIKGERREREREGGRRVRSSWAAESGQCTSCPAPLHVPIPVPVPVPVPVFVPVPWNPALQAATGRYVGGMTTGHSLRFDVSRFGGASPAGEIPGEDSLRRPEEDGVVLKLYKALDTRDRSPVSTPEGILRVTEDRLGDFTDIRDDQSASSTSSEDEGGPRVPSTRIYRLRKESSGEDSSGEFSLAATPPGSLTSSPSPSDSSDEESTDGGGRPKFNKTFVVNDSDSEKEGEEKRVSDSVIEPESPESASEESESCEVTCECVDSRTVPCDGVESLSEIGGDPAEDLDPVALAEPETTVPLKDAHEESDLEQPETEQTVLPDGEASAESDGDTLKPEVESAEESLKTETATMETPECETDDVSQSELPPDNDPEVIPAHLSPTTEPLSQTSDDKANIETVAEAVVGDIPCNEAIDSIITFSHVEILQIMAEFLEAERYIYEMKKTIEKMDKNLEGEVGPETRSNTSDEFSGTESMEMPLEDSLECGGATEAGQVRAGGAVSGTVPGESCKETGRYTSLVMITQEQGGPEKPPPPGPPREEVTVVTGADTLSAVVCLEEGLADDDSWVEELDREEMATTTEESSEEECFPDREEELRGYHRSAIDFTLHTIVEESCEESEVEVEKTRPTELEKYFFYGLGECVGDEEREIDTLSETSSIYSEGLESVGGTEHQSDNNGDPAELASSRLEKYFLNGFMDFRRDSDGSVGSDSEGKPSPEQRRKRLVRARGTARQHSSSLDNLTESEQQVELQPESTSGSSTETDSHDEQSNSFEKNDGQFDTVKRTKKKKRSVSSAPSMELLEAPEDCAVGLKEDANSDEGKKTPQPEFLSSSDLGSRNKQQSRDSGFMGSCDDLLKESRDSPGVDSTKNEDETSSTHSPCEPEKSIPELTFSSPPATALTRKDSFNNWSSDEETNLMMSKMRAFFKTMVGSQAKSASPNVKPKTKPPQLLYFESELTRLMKTVPGIKDEQVKEIVEYLSSEDTWSDSYDSSDYTSSDLESGNKKSALQEEISASCRQIISNFETSNAGEDSPVGSSAVDALNKDSVYHRLVASFSKIEAPVSDPAAPQNSPPLMEKVMQHIGTRLVALMHEVSGGEGSSPRAAKHHRRPQPKPSATSTTEEEEDSMEDYSPLPRSKSHDPLLEENKQEASDNERFSWRGSFESALMASDSRTRLASAGEGSASASALALAAKRRSAGDLMFKSCSREQLDRVRSCGSIGGSVEDKIWATQRAARRQRRSSESGGSADGDDDSEEEGGRATLPRLQPSAGPATNSLPRLPTCPPAPTMYKAHSVHNVKSARYRPPGYRGSGGPPPRRDQRRRPTSSPAPLPLVCDDASVCSEPVGRGAEEEVDRLHRASLGARSDSLASVYSGAGEGRHGGVAVKGEVQFGLQYNYKQSSLEIHVKQCRDLAPVDIKRNRSDPYVKVYLLPDKSKSGKRKTRVKKHTLNPIFEETLRFQVSLDGLENRTLWLSVWHSDMFGRNDFLGEVLMPLENKVFDDPLPKFYTLQERSEPLEELNSKGELIVGLKFVPPEGSGNKKRPSKGCLLVLVKEAKNLPAVKSNGTSDPFCKSYLLPDKGRGSKQKAPVLRRTCSPAWNHTFTYNNISLPELSERSLELTIWDHDRLASNEFLGGVRLNLGSGKQNGKIVDWMDSSGNEIILWQRMMERPNFWVESCLPLRPSLDVRKN